MQNAAQIEFWNSDTAKNWVTHDALMEAMLAPLGERVMDALEPTQGLPVPPDLRCWFSRNQSQRMRR